MSWMYLHRFKLLGGAIFISPAALLFGGGFYYFPDLRSNPHQMTISLIRTLRVAVAGVRMASIYKKEDNRPIEDKHEEASLVLRESFVKNAGLYLKFAQLLSSLDVIVPEEYRRNFEPLCHECPENTFENVKSSIEISLGKPIDEIYSKFNPKPIKSASIAQVHEAVLKSTGEKVAVKVKHDWLQQHHRGDLKVISLFVDIGERFFPEFKFKWFADEINEVLPRELDFREEVRNSEKARELLKEYKNVYIPRNIFEFCSDRVITMEFVDGLPIMDVEALRRNNYDLPHIAKSISEAFCAMIFRYGFVHSDPHQGNLLIRKQKNGQDQVVLLDHGLYKNLTDSFRLSYSRLWLAIIKQQKAQIVSASCELGVAKEKANVFASMITSREYDDIMSDSKDMKDRLRSPKTVEERKIVQSIAARHHKDIIQILHEMNSDLLLLMKTNDFLRTIDNKLGSPVNTFEITLKFCYEEIEKSSPKRTFWSHLLLQLDRLWIQIKLMALKQSVVSDSL